MIPGLSGGLQLICDTRKTTVINNELLQLRVDMPGNAAPEFGDPS